MADKRLLEDGTSFRLLEDGTSFRLLEVPQSFIAAVLALGPVAGWRLGETTGTVADDAIGTNDGTYQNTPTLGVTGALSGDTDKAALFVAASSEYVNVPDNAALDFGDGPFTALWFHQLASTAGGYLLVKGTQFVIRMTGQKVTVDDDNNPAFITETDPPLDFATEGAVWHMGAFTHATGDSKLFRDGVERTWKLTVDRVLASNATALTIAAYTGGAAPFNGAIDEVWLFDKVLTPTEIATLYAARTVSTSTTHQVTGAAAGAGTASGTLQKLAVNVTGAAAGAGTASGALTLFRGVSGAAAGAGTASGAASRTLRVTGSATGTGQASGLVVGSAASMYQNIVGPAMGIDSRNNYNIGNLGNREASYRFRASQSSAPKRVAINQRYGTTGQGYSEGTGGTIRIQVLADDGTGKPNTGGTVYATLTFAPDNSSAHEDRNYLDFDAGASALVAGQLYHLVFHNTHASPTTNYMSVNAVYWDSPPAYPAQRQPAFTNDLAVLFSASGVWKQPGDSGLTDPNPQQDTPVFDLEYVNGGHDGQAYFGIIDGSQRTIGGTNMVREILQITGGDKVVDRAGFRVMRTAGSGDLTIGVYTSGGTLLASGTVTAATFPTVSPPSGNFFGSVYGEISFSPITLTNGSTYYIRASAPAGTTYYTAPIEAHDNPLSGNPDWQSRLITGAIGVGQDGAGGGGDYSTNSGSSWSAMYGGGAPADAQAYLKPTSTQALTGSATGTGNASGSFLLYREVAGSAAGAGTASGSVLDTRPVTGSAAGVGAASGSILRVQSVTGTAAGVGTASGSAGISFAASGSATGAGTASGSISITRAASGSAAGAGTASGAAFLTLGASSTAAGTGQATGSLTKSIGVTGSATGTGQAAGDLQRVTLITGSAAGVGTASGSLAATIGLTGSATGVGTAAAGGSYVWNVTGSALGSGAATASATRTAGVSGSATGTGNASGAAGIRTPITGTALGTGNASGNLTGSGQIPLSGSATGVGSISGSIALTLAASGSAAGAGQASGQPSRILGESGSAVGTGASSGSVTMTRGFAGSAIGVGLATGIAGLRMPLSGSATGVGTATGIEWSIRPLTGAAAGVGLLTGAADVFSDIHATDPGAYAIVTVTSGPYATLLVTLSDVSQSDRPSATVAVVSPSADLERV